MNLLKSNLMITLLITCLLFKHTICDPNGAKNGEVDKTQDEEGAQGEGAEEGQEEDEEDQRGNIGSDSGEPEGDNQAQDEEGAQGEDEEEEEEETDDSDKDTRTQEEKDEEERVRKETDEKYKEEMKKRYKKAEEDRALREKQFEEDRERIRVLDIKLFGPLEPEKIPEEYVPASQINKEHNQTLYELQINKFMPTIEEFLETYSKTYGRFIMNTFLKLGFFPGWPKKEVLEYTFSKLTRLQFINAGLTSFLDDNILNNFTLKANVRGPMDICPPLPTPKKRTPTQGSKSTNESQNSDVSQKTEESPQAGEKSKPEASQT